MVGRTGVTLIIPAWNEVEAIGALLDEVPIGAVDHVLVVVSGPTDSTASAARGRGAHVLIQPQPGYGAACRAGAESALSHGARVVAFLDGDYADPPAELPRLLAPLLGGRADLVLGCRTLHRFPNALPPHARLGNRLVLCVLQLLLGARFGDLPSYKAIRADALLQLDMRETTYGWTVEMLVKAVRAGLRIEELAIDYRPRLGGRSKVAGSVLGSLRAAATLLACAVAYINWRPTASGQWPAISGQ